MKKIILLGLLISFFGCKSSDSKSAKAHKSGKAITITAAELKTSVSVLASNELKGRNTGSKGIETAATYVEKQFKSYGLKPYYKTYRDSFKVKALDAYNVVAYLEGNDSKLKEEVIIIGAHYDHIGIIKVVENDSIANGANDNAAGSSGVLAMAKYFATRKNNKRSLMFVLFSAEEMGLLGSKHLAQRLKKENLNLYTMVNLEMIGVPFKDRDYVAFVTGYDTSNMAKKINDYVGSHFIGASEVAKKYDLFTHSDNYPFYNAFKKPSQTISSCDLSNYDFYHHVDDEIDKLDYDHMASLINKIIPAIETMSNTENQEIVINEN